MSRYALSFAGAALIVAPLCAVTAGCATAPTPPRSVPPHLTCIQGYRPGFITSSAEGRVQVEIREIDGFPTRGPEPYCAAPGTHRLGLRAFDDSQTAQEYVDLPMEGGNLYWLRAQTQGIGFRFQLWNVSAEPADMVALFTVKGIYVAQPQAVAVPVGVYVDPWLRRPPKRRAPPPPPPRGRLVLSAPATAPVPVHIATTQEPPTTRANPGENRWGQDRRLRETGEAFPDRHRSERDSPTQPEGTRRDATPVAREWSGRPAHSNPSGNRVDPGDRHGVERPDRRTAGMPIVRTGRNRQRSFGQEQGWPRDGDEAGQPSTIPPQ